MYAALLFFLPFLDIARSKFLLSVLKKVICFYSLGAFPRQFHSSISVRLVATSHNFILFSPSLEELPLFLSLVRFLFKIRVFDSVRVSTLHAFLLLFFIYGFIFSIWLVAIYSPSILIFRMTSLICELEVSLVDEIRKT